MLNLCDDDFFFLVLTAHRISNTIQSLHSSQRKNNNNNNKIYVFRLLSSRYFVDATALDVGSCGCDAIVCARSRRSPTHILQITWIDGSENVLTEGVEYVKEPSSSDSRRFTAKSILKLKANKDYHNKTIICQAQNSVDKTYRSAAIRLEVRWIYIFFNEHNTFTFLLLPPPSLPPTITLPVYEYVLSVHVVHLFPVCLRACVCRSCLNSIFASQRRKRPSRKWAFKVRMAFARCLRWQKVLMRKCRCRRQIDTQTRIDGANCFNLFLMLTFMIPFVSI